MCNISVPWKCNENVTRYIFVTFPWRQRKCNIFVPCNALRMHWIWWNSMKFDRIWKCDLRMAHNSKSVRRVTLTAHCVHQSIPNPISERYLVQMSARNALKCTCERFPGEVHFQFGLKMSVTFFVSPDNQRSKFPKIEEEGAVWMWWGVTFSEFRYEVCSAVKPVSSPTSNRILPK